jgi:hypothetical protein
VPNQTSTTGDFFPFMFFFTSSLKLSYDIGFVYKRTDGHGETSIPPYNFVAGGIILLKVALNTKQEHRPRVLDARIFCI